MQLHRAVAESESQPPLPRLTADSLASPPCLHGLFVISETPKQIILTDHTMVKVTYSYGQTTFQRIKQACYSGNESIFTRKN